MCLAALLTGLSKPASADLLNAAPVVSGTLAHPLKAVAYADAMVDCAERIHATLVEGCDIVPADLEVRHSFWIWQSDTGATVSRTRNGDYRIRARSCLGGFCSWLSCRVTDWPSLSCSDGGKLKARVPDQMHFNLGGTDYVRIRQAR